MNALSLPVEPSAALRETPAIIGRFAIRGEIGRGSNGVVYAAHDPVLGREVAIKAVPLSSDSYFREQIEKNFLQEAKAAAGLNHPNIVTVFDAGKTDTLAYIAMERLHGRDLHDFLASGSRLSPRQAAAMMARVADAVHYANKRGLIHRDIKPSNIFLVRDAKPKVLDFGVALALGGESNATQKRQLIGTPNYMSPEQALGKRLDARSDVFSIGTILYEMLVGQRAFEGKTIEETLSQVITEAPAPIGTLRPEMPADLIAIVDRALAKDPDGRYQTAGELRNDLQAYVARAGGTTKRAPGTRRTLHNLLLAPLRARTLQWVSIAGALGVAAVGVAVALRGQERAPVPLGANAPFTAPGSAPQAPAQVDSTLPKLATAPVQSNTASDADAAPAGIAPAKPAAEPAKRVAEPPRRKRVETAAAAPVAPAADGFVSLAIAPWGEVLVNGISRGVSPPLTRLTLPPGQHTIEVRNNAAAPYTARVEIRPGQSLTVQHKF
jgi:serine/threonine-protein kinase